jgi:hypothetical protein
VTYRLGRGKWQTFFYSVDYIFWKLILNPFLCYERKCRSENESISSLHTFSLKETQKSSCVPVWAPGWETGRSLSTQPLLRVSLYVVHLSHCKLAVNPLTYSKSRVMFMFNCAAVEQINNLSFNLSFFLFFLNFFFAVNKQKSKIMATFLI